MKITCVKFRLLCKLNICLLTSFLHAGILIFIIVLPIIRLVRSTIESASEFVPSFEKNGGRDFQILGGFVDAEVSLHERTQHFVGGEAFGHYLMLGFESSSDSFG
jgi:hypothetical protein